MEHVIEPRHILPLVNELTDALVSGRVSVTDAPPDGWHYWACDLVQRDQGYELSRWTVGFPVAPVEGWENVALGASLGDLLASCDQRGIPRPAGLHLFFCKGPEVQLQLLAGSDPGRQGIADPDTVWCDLDSAAEPVLQELHQRWGNDTPEARQGQALVRDPDAWWGDLTDRINRHERQTAERRDAITDYLAAQESGGEVPGGPSMAGLARAADDGMLRDFDRYFRLRFSRGDDVDELRDFVESGYQHTKVAFAMLEHRANTPQFTTDPLHGREYVAVWDTVELLIVATLLGRSDIARDLLSHPAISHVPYRAVDVLAIVHDVPQASGLDDMRRPVWKELKEHESWIKLGATTPGRRQAAFEKYVRNWPSMLAKTRRSEQWCVEAALFAVLFGVDDSAVRDERWYPSDLVDYARELGVQPLPAKLKLPGPWKKPTPPKVLEPTEHRQPQAFSSDSGELALADFAALVAPVSAEPSVGSFDELLEGALAAGSVAMINWKGVDLEADVAMLQSACGTLGLRVPGRNPTKMPKSTERALPRFDEWLEPLGVRLLELDIDSDDAFVLPVLVDDYARTVDRKVDHCILRAAGAPR